MFRLFLASVFLALITFPAAAKTPDETALPAAPKCMTVDAVIKNNDDPGIKSRKIDGDAAKTFLSNVAANATPGADKIPDADLVLILIKDKIAVFIPFSHGCAAGGYGAFAVSKLPALLGEDDGSI